MYNTDIKGRDTLKKLSFSIALGGIVSALCILMMFSVGLFPVLVYVFPMLCGLLMYVLYYECGCRTAIVSYVSVSLLALILSPDKESAVLFLAYFGYYTVLDQYIIKLKSAVLQWVIRLGIFNAAVAASYFVLTKLFTAVTLDDFGKWTVPILLIFANIIAVLYEISFRRLSVLYEKKLRKAIFRRK